MVVRISGSEGISFNDEAFATEPFVTSALEDIPVFQKKIARFTGDGTWTVPAGVTYAIAHMLGGGGGAGIVNTGGNGGSSSVAFASGTVSALGSPSVPYNSGTAGGFRAAVANSGRSASTSKDGGTGQGIGVGQDAQWLVAGAAVTPAASITVTVGAGGTAGTSGAAGGSGYVYIEYYEEI